VFDGDRIDRLAIIECINPCYHNDLTTDDIVAMVLSITVVATASVVVIEIPATLTLGGGPAPADS